MTVLESDMMADGAAHSIARIHISIAVITVNDFVYFGAHTNNNMIEITFQVKQMIWWVFWCVCFEIQFNAWMGKEKTVQSVLVIL